MGFQTAYWLGFLFFRQLLCYWLLTSFLWLWTIYLSFTNYRANQPGRPIRWIGTRNYERLLGSEDIWGYLQATAHFVIWTMVLQVLIGFSLALLINRHFRGRWFLDYHNSYSYDALPCGSGDFLDLSLSTTDWYIPAISLTSLPI